MVTDASSPPAADDGGLFVGLISGTSVDGIDAALVRFDPAPALVLARTFALEADLARAILDASQGQGQMPLDELGRLDTRLGQAFADAALDLLASAGVDRRTVRAIGSHGQTLRHRPEGEAPFTLQLGDGNVIAERTGIDTVADFRRRDVAAGGHGAPLVPAFHAAILRDPNEPRAILNIGGIANLTLLPAQGPVRGFDTGPGNGLMDAWCLLHRGESYDRGGAFAAAGTADESLLQRLLADPWLALPPPKSTGRDQFHLEWLAERMAGLALAPADVQASLCEFSARSIARALLGQLPDCRRVVVCGGGVHNASLMARLRAALPGMMVESSASHGIDPDFMEAMAFAWLARERLVGRPGNLPEVTGARGARLLGVIYPA